MHEREFIHTNEMKKKYLEFWDTNSSPNPGQKIRPNNIF